MNLATDGPTPNPCNSEIFQKGKGVCVVDGSSNAVERWVKSIAKKADAKVDWHYSGGRANVLHLGDEASRQRVMDAIIELENSLEGSIISIGGPALYRKGVEDHDAIGGATFTRVNGQTVIIDPTAVALIQAVEKENCKNTLKLNADRVEHFKNRMIERGTTPDESVIVCLNVDDVHGEQIADILMPGYDWQAIRDKGETPFALGIAMRDFIQEALNAFDSYAATELHNVNEISVVIVDHGVAEVFVA